MTVFDELQSQWENQSQPDIPLDGVKRVKERLGEIGSKQRITNIVLGITAMVLIAFFFYISAFKFRTVMIGLLLMVAALGIRIGIEVFSIARLRSLNVSVDVKSFRRQLANYYKRRKTVHFLITPLLIVQYCVGFVMLTPSFKSSLSTGFYYYVIISAVLLLLVLGVFIAKQIRNELRKLKDLNS